MGSQYHHQSRRGQTDRALIVHPVLHGTVQTRSPEACLVEAVGLAHAINLDVAQARTVKVSRPQPATLLGGGTVAELAGLIAEAEDQGEPIDLVVVDHALSPVQQRNLEQSLGTKVIDRTGLILEIFGARARTREGQLQVELAALSYQRSRLVRSYGTDISGLV
jgi:GTP-binding protein HflX